jgi:hypothetical protein
MEGLNQTKYCGRCKTILDISCFAKNKVKKDGLQERCKYCRAIHAKENSHKRKKPTRENKRKYLLSSYGLTVEDFKGILREQNNCCAICLSPEWGRPSPSVDHCHATGKVRGLLCNVCNRALGMFKDNIGVLENAIEYLKTRG